MKKLNEIISCCIDRISCLFEFDSKVDFAKMKELSTKDIFDKQSELMRKELIIVFSAFPKFLIDYYKLSVLEDMFLYVKTYFEAKCKLKIKI